MPVLTAYHKVEWRPPGNSWTDITQHVIQASGTGELTGDRANALSFGEASDASATVVVRDTLASTAWALTPIRITFRINATESKAFTGVITGRRRATGELTFACSGPAELIKAKKLHSRLFYMRRVATKTTTSSIEDPTNPNYEGGLINFLLWQAGGRPVEQDFNTTYQAQAVFWYSCAEALIAPKWTWAAGEEAWSECLKLAQSSGGQMYQAGDGTVIYKQPFSIGDGTVAFTFTQDVWEQDPEEEATTEKLTTKITVNFATRDLRPLQQIAEDTTVRNILAGRSLTYPIDPQNPIYSLQLRPNTADKLPDGALVVTDLSHQTLTEGTHYTQSVVWYAQHIEITITNLTNRTIRVWNTTLNGEPLIVSESGSVTLGDGSIERIIQAENVYIQHEAHARQLAFLILLFYGAARPTRSIRGCPFDPSRFIGEIVGMSYPAWGITNEPHVILSIAHDDTGLVADYVLLPVGDLPITPAYLVVGRTYTANQTIKLVA